MSDAKNAEAIFLAALEKATPHERAAYVQGACANDAGLLSRVQELLKAHDQSQGPFDVPPPGIAGTVAESINEPPGTMIGPYKLLQQIGEGGFGVVYMAEQLEPVRRKVALKILKPGMDTRQVVARFEAERQALAIMDHPNIAKVFDGGATPSGRPYFVMELVKGVPITKFCDQNHLTPRQRLELFVTVCQAVQHAHQKAIIHRDLKPSNVLVSRHDTTPIVKVIDFGVAKALGQELTDKTLFTGIAQMIGTPLYMSPEQAGMSDLDVDTRSDIYSLGVMLYELLTGTTPFSKERFKQAAYDEIRRIIREEEPPKPSTRLTDSKDSLPSISAQRDTEPARLTKLVKGELDWIVMKALEKDRNRRYETANGFAMDLQRYLADEPVRACPPSASYRLRKFARRKKAALLTATVVALAILFGSGSWLWRAAEQAARKTATEQLVDDALQNAATLLAQGKWPEAKAVAERAEWRLNEGGGPQKQRIRVQQLLADLEMVAQLEECRLKYTQLNSTSYDYTASDSAYAAAFQAYGIDVAALEPSEMAKRIRASAIHSHLVSALDHWTWIRSTGRIPGYERLRSVASLADSDDWRNRFRDAVEKKNSKAIEELANSPEVASQPLSMVVVLVRALPRDAKSSATAEKVLLAAHRRHPEDFWVNLHLVELYSWKRPAQPEKAVGFCRAAIAIRPNNAALHNGLGLSLLNLPGQLDDAIEAFRKTVELKPDFAWGYTSLGDAFGKKGARDEANAAYRESIRLYRESIRLNPNAADIHHSLAWVYILTLAPDKAIAELKETLRLSPRNAVAQRQLSFLLSIARDPQLRDPAQALALATTAVKLAPKDGDCVLTLGIARYRTNDWDGAIVTLTEADRFFPSGNPYVWFFLAMACGKKGELEQARSWYDRAVRSLGQRQQWLDSMPCVKEDLSLFRAEAADILGIPITTSPSTTKTPPKKP